ncbi:MAG: glycosyltransferase family 2 protein [Phycisphaerales bacterium]
MAPVTERPRTPLPLSVSIVCKDNQATIGRTLASVRGLASEIVAVDSGSTDGTLDLLRGAGARVIEEPWRGFVKQKQFALEHCGQAWVLHLDSDESVTPALAGAIREAIERDPKDVGGCAINRRVWWGDHELRHAWQPEWRLRLVRNGAAKWGGYDPHDAMELTDASLRTMRLDRGAVMRHDSILTLTDFMEKQARHARVAARSYHAMGRRGSTLKMITSPVGAWCKMVLLKGAWRDGWRGMCAASVASMNAMMKHGALLELQRSRSDHDPT